MISTAVSLALPASGPSASSMALASPPISPIVIPQAITSFAQSAFSWMVAHNVQTIAGIMLGVPLLAALEAGYIVMKYRSDHGSAPCPLTPSHGSVTVDMSANSNAHEVSLQAMSGKSLDPLRLLVIGDSLAAGVGTVTSCTPLLPESIATSLSRDLGGRTVQWTVIGEPGASAGWITRTLESFRFDNGDNDGKQEQRQQQSKDDEKDVYTHTIEGWIRKQLVEDDEDGGGDLSSTLDADVGQYDVAVLLTGSNDLKFAVLPWMFRKQRKEERTVKNGDFAAELRNAIEAVSRKMRAGLSESIDRVLTSVEEGFDAVRSSVEEALPEAVLDRIIWSNITNGYVLMRGGGDAAMAAGDIQLSSEESAGSEESAHGPNSSSQKGGNVHQRHRPLVVLPALPAKVLPASKIRPLNWIAFPLLRVIENAKRKLSNLYPDSIVFVEAPRRSDFEDFIQEEGPIWHRKQLEGHVKSVTDVNPLECQQTLHLMHEYSQEDGRASPEPFLATDGVHPNDLGYSYWGRMIASSIVEEWAASGCGACATTSTVKANAVDVEQKL